MSVTMFPCVESEDGPPQRDVLLAETGNNLLLLDPPPLLFQELGVSVTRMMDVLLQLGSLSSPLHIHHFTILTPTHVCPPSLKEVVSVAFGYFTVCVALVCKASLHSGLVKGLMGSFSDFEGGEADVWTLFCLKHHIYFMLIWFS